MDEPIVKTESRARQGGKGRPVLYVLIASLVLLGVYMVGLMTWSSSTSQNNVSNQSSDAMRETTTGSTTGRGGASSANTGNVPTANPAYPAPATPTANGNRAPSGDNATPVTPTPAR
jgi:hypothetical protein